MEVWQHRDAWTVGASDWTLGTKALHQQSSNRLVWRLCERQTGGSRDPSLLSSCAILGKLHNLPWSVSSINEDSMSPFLLSLSIHGMMCAKLED